MPPTMKKRVATANRRPMTQSRAFSTTWPSVGGAPATVVVVVVGSGAAHAGVAVRTKVTAAAVSRAGHPPLELLVALLLVRGRVVGRLGESASGTRRRAWLTSLRVLAGLGAPHGVAG